MKRAALSILFACNSPEPAPAPVPLPAAPRDAAVRVADAPEHPVKQMLRDSAFAEPLIVGPGLWANLLLTERRMKRDAVAKLGTASQVIVPGEEALVLDNRTFADAKTRDAFVATETFRGLVTTFLSATVRDATADERKRLHVLVPFETDKGVKMFELGKRSLIVVVENDKIFWIDSFDGYCTNMTICPR